MIFCVVVALYHDLLLNEEIAPKKERTNTVSIQELVVGNLEELILLLQGLKLGAMVIE